MPLVPCRQDDRKGYTVSDLLTEEQLADAPERYFCPISFELMMLPVVLVPTGQVFDHLSLITWFQSGTVKLQADVALREEISAWLQAHGKDPDAIRRAILQGWRDADLYGKRGRLRQSRQRRQPHRGAIVSAMLSFLTSRTYARVYAQIY